MNTSNRAIKGTAWTLTERVSVQAIQFVIGIILARILAPEDYGMVAMLAVFLAIAQILMDSGFGNALIRKKERTSEDLSTVFHFNMAVSLMLYAVLFFTAPLIARFYEIPELTLITRVIALSIILNATSAVQVAKFTAELRFRQQSLIAIAAVVCSGAVGIYMAVRGFGVWALVAQTLTMAAIRSIAFWTVSTWRPALCFSKASFREMFPYGSRLLASGLIHTLYTNLYTLTIGKAFSATDAGYFNRANIYGVIPNDILSQVSNKVFFPVLAKKQDDNDALLAAYGKAVKVTMCLYMPLMFGMAAMSSQLLEALVGAKWLPAAPLLMILCIGYAFAPMSALNLNLLYVKGRSDITLKLDFIKKSIGIAILFAMLPLGIKWMCIGKACYELVAFYANTVYTRKVLNYGFLRQFGDILTTLLKALVMFAAVVLVTNAVELNVWLELLIGFATGVTVYLLLSLILRDKAFRELRSVLSERNS